MIGESPHLERLPGESQRAYDTLIEYWRLGIDRSLTKLRDALLSTEKATVKPATLGTLKTWSQKHHWVERARQADASSSQLVIEAHQSDYMNSIANLREASESFGKDIFDECRLHLRLLQRQRKSIGSNAVKTSELAAMARTLLTLAQIAEATVAVRCRALGIDRVIEQLLKEG